MADADEDVINTNVPEEEDGEEEVPDWTAFAAVSKSKTGAIPKRGEKDFESHGTSTQANKLDTARQAVHDALSIQRTHQPKRQDIAIYHPESNMAYIERGHSTLFKSMGKTHSPKDDPLGDIKPNSSRMWFLPEEILYLIERGTVDCRWPAQDGDADDLGLPMSLQGAHAVFLGLSEQHNDGLNHERYSVYSYLKRAGYSVHRAPTWNQSLESFNPETFPPLPGTWTRLGIYADSWKQWWTAPSKERLATGPLTDKKIFRSYPDIYRSLAMICWYNPTVQRESSERPREQKLQITWNVWKPNNTVYKKSKPGPPDFRIAVMDSRSTGLPSLADLAGLVDTQPYQPPPTNMQLYAKLKHGYKSVILAVVDEGVTSFIRLSDAAFGLEPLYEKSSKPTKGKGGGRKPKQAPANKTCPYSATHVQSTTFHNLAHSLLFNPTYREPYLPAGLHISTDEQLKSLELNVARFVLVAVSRGEDGATILQRIQDLRDGDTTSDHSEAPEDSVTAHGFHLAPRMPEDQRTTNSPSNHHLSDRQVSYGMQSPEHMELYRREQALKLREADLDQREEELKSQAEILETNMRWREYQTHQQQLQHKPTRLNWPIHPTTETDTKPTPMVAQVRRDSGIEVQLPGSRDHSSRSSLLGKNLTTASEQPRFAFSDRRAQEGQTFAQLDPRTEKENSRTLTPPEPQGPTPIIVIPDSPTPDRDTTMANPPATGEPKPAPFLSPSPSTPASHVLEQHSPREHQEAEHADLFQLEREMIDAIGAELMDLNQKAVPGEQQRREVRSREEGGGGQDQSGGLVGDQGRVQSALESMGWTRARDGAV
ncbi:hypothetical protein BDZ85DRAFT_282374 [Elsinoe ampelina]|uniref:tRNA-splicing endonuclease subunit Sen54 N-terminal domain-containing protein n=1 Tax=Elsinoe ampelina TaxID=302913 RepID=A0A6A6G9N6_9PEZI|nr:hypothetical protein BDZ85DRAFT_282374 [Elsinoe ampelina]